MLISRITLSNFTKHTQTTLTLPTSGIVAVTGDNGSGKSSFLEAVATGLFGETLRGASPWRNGVDGFVQVETDSLVATRKRSEKGKTSLSWNLIGKEAESYETTTKAQEALEKLVGSFLVWRRTCVFSSQDASHFTLATDAERKKLLEGLLNIQRFDLALEACRAELKVAEQKEQTFLNGLVLAKAKLEAERQRVKDFQTTLLSIPEPVNVSEVEASLSKLKAYQSQISKEMTELDDQQREAYREATLKEASALASVRKLKTLDVDLCTTCNQPIAVELKNELRKQVSAEQALADEAKKKAEVLRADIQIQLQELKDEKDVLMKKEFALRSQLQNYEAVLSQRKSAESRLQAAQAAADDLEKRLSKGEDSTQQIQRDVALLKAVDSVLGTKGVRNHILGKTLTGIETLANDWLSKIAGAGLQLSLKPYVEKKTGGVSEAISLDVLGAGGGFGYKASSGGERRRIDVALLLALADVAQAAYGRENKSTLFFDECMDSLDKDGATAVAQVLRELSTGRCVVVITHDENLLRELKADNHVRIVDGKIEK